jgi:RNA polymerase sigma-70 factor (ECF subfamily)
MATETLRRSDVAAPPRAEPASPTIAEVYERHFRYVWRCLRSLGVPGDALEDAAHDVFLVVQKKLESFDGSAQLTTWLYGIALRVARRYRARAAKDARRLAPPAAPTGDDSRDDDPIAAAASPGDLQSDLEQSERLELARRALACLDDDKREIFVLALVEQRSAPEIARITDLPVNTVYSRLRAARLVFSAHVARLKVQSPRRTR